MVKKIDEYRKQNKDKMIVGFCLELKSLQEFISKDLDLFISFIEENENFFNNLDIRNFTTGIENMKCFFDNFTDLIYNDVDKDDKYMAYHRDFY